MNETKTISIGHIARHFIWYFSSSFLALLIGLIKSPVYTERFTAGDFGLYSLVSIGFGYLSLLLLSWLSASVWRYYYRYERNNQVTAFYSNLYFLFLICVMLFLCITIAAVLWTDNPMIKRLMVLSFFHFSIMELLNLSLIHLRLKNQVRRYNLLMGIQAVTGFGILLFLTFYLNNGIEAFLTSAIIINLLLFLMAGVPFIRRVTGFKLVFNKAITITVFQYSKILLIANFLGLLLISLDRYFIQYYKGESETGIYNQAYGIANTIIMAGIQVFFSAISPIYTNLLEFRGAAFKRNYGKLIALYLCVFIPLVTYFSLFSETITRLLLKGPFGRYPEILPPVAFSCLLLGLINFAEFKLKFDNNRRRVFRGFGLAVLLNCLLNVLLLPEFSFVVAGYTTLATYLSLFFYFYFRDMKYYLSACHVRLVAKAGIILFTQVVIHLFMVRHRSFSGNLFFIAAEGLFFVITYYYFNRKFFTSFKSIELSA